MNFLKRFRKQQAAVETEIVPVETTPIPAPAPAYGTLAWRYNFQHAQMESDRNGFLFIVEDRTGSASLTIFSGSDETGWTQEGFEAGYASASLAIVRAEVWAQFLENRSREIAAHAMAEAFTAWQAQTLRQMFEVR